MTALSIRSGLFDRLTDLFERVARAPRIEETDAHQSLRERRRILLETDPQACCSDYGAQMLMAQFPRDF